jgi:TetR/AcrR family transcriptional regulator, cholesterol catabolism regulator
MNAESASLPAVEAAAEPKRGTLERLFDTAAALFRDKGYAATTTREMAAALGIQQASLYYHITSKEDLFHQLCVSSLTHLHADVESAVNEVHEPLGRICTLIRAHLQTLLVHQCRHVLMLTELRALSNAHHAEVLALRKKYARLVESVLEEGQAGGVIRRDVPAKYLYLALLNILNWAALWFRRDQELPAERLAGLFTPIYLHGAAASPAHASLVPPVLAAQRRKPAVKAPRLATPEASTSERMLRSAAALFSTKGYSATSLREIAALLRIQKASLYYHIAGKEDLLYEICRGSLGQIRRDVETAVQQVEDPLERTRALVRAHIESMLRDQDQHTVTLSEMRALSEERLAQVISLRDAYEDLVRSVLEHAQAAGVLRQDIPVKYLTLHLLGMMNRVEVWYRPNGPLTPAQIGELLAAIFLSGAAARGD